MKRKEQYEYRNSINLSLLADKSRRKLQSMENFIDAITTVQIPDDYKLVYVFRCEITVHQYSTSTGITVYRVRYTTIYC